MELFNQPGWIEVVTGPMFAGKSEELIRRVRRLQYAHKNVMVFKPVIDDRYSIDNVESHLHNKVKAYPAKSSEDIRAHMKELPDAIVIDEVQFFDEGVIALADELADKGVRVIVGGLDSDFRGNPFPIVADLLARAESVTKLTAICVKCGAPATRTQRIINGVPAHYNDPTILVGANESYEPRCRHCHEVKKD